MTEDRALFAPGGFCPGCNQAINSTWACAKCWQEVPKEIQEMRRQAWYSRRFGRDYRAAKEAMVRFFMERRGGEKA